MKHNVASRVTVALTNGAGNTSTSYIDLGPGGGAHLKNGRFLISLPLCDSLANAGTIACELTHCATSGGSYTTVEGYGNMIVTGAGGTGSPADDFEMPIAPHILQYVKAKFTQTGTGDNSDETASFEVLI